MTMRSPPARAGRSKTSVTSTAAGPVTAAEETCTALRIGKGPGPMSTIALNSIPSRAVVNTARDSRIIRRVSTGNATRCASHGIRTEAGKPISQLKLASEAVISPVAGMFSSITPTVVCPPATARGSPLNCAKPASPADPARIPLAAFQMNPGRSGISFPPPRNWLEPPFRRNARRTDCRWFPTPRAARHRNGILFIGSCTRRSRSRLLGLSIGRLSKTDLMQRSNSTTWPTIQAKRAISPLTIPRKSPRPGN